MTGPVGSRAPAAGLLGRLARIVVTSLVMSGCGSGWTARGQLCAEDEFFDTVVDRCSLCRDVCDLCLRPESGHFCSRNCPGSRGPELSVGLFIYLFINSGIEFNTSITQIQGSQQQQYKQRRNEKAATIPLTFARIYQNNKRTMTLGVANHTHNKDRRTKLYFSS